MPHFFMHSTGGLKVVAIADTTAEAEARAAAAGLPRVGRRPYRADLDDLRAHAGAYWVVGELGASWASSVTLTHAAAEDRAPGAWPPAHAVSAVPAVATERRSA